MRLHPLVFVPALFCACLFAQAPASATNPDGAAVRRNLMEEGSRLFQHRDFMGAIGNLRSLCADYAQSPECAASRLTLATAYYLTSDYLNAARSLEHGSQNSRHQAEALHMLGNSYLYQGKLTAAQGVLANLYGVPAESPQARLLVARMLIRLQREEEAEPILQLLSAQSPELPLSHYYLELLHLYRSEFTRAAESFRSEIMLNPAFADAHYKLGDTEGRLGKWDAAIPHLQKAIWLNPDQSGPYILLGKAYLQSGDHSNAEAMLWRAIQVDPNSEAALFLLGQTLVKSRRRLEAGPIFDRIKELKHPAVRAAEASVRP